MDLDNTAQHHKTYRRDFESRTKTYILQAWSFPRIKKKKTSAQPTGMNPEPEGGSQSGVEVTEHGVK